MRDWGPTQFSACQLNKRQSGTVSTLGRWQFIPMHGSSKAISRKAACLLNALFLDQRKKKPKDRRDGDRRDLDEEGVGAPAKLVLIGVGCGGREAAQVSPTMYI